MSASLTQRAGAFARARGRISAEGCPGETRRARVVARVSCAAKPAPRGEYYAGKGKYIKDDRGLVSKTGRDDAFTGGFAGGERGLWSYRDELAETNAAKALEKAKAKRRETREVRLQKDFGGMAGGFPGGEIGVKSFNATGEVPAAKPPTLGWGPPALGTVAVVAGYTYYTTGELSQEALVKAVETLTTKASEIDPSAVAQDAGAVASALGLVAGALGQVVNLLPEEVKDAGSHAAFVAFMILFGGVMLRILVGEVVSVVGKYFKVTALALVSGTIALKLLHIL
jgi:hypothetical protein